MTPDQADAQAVATLLQLQALLSTSASTPAPAPAPAPAQPGGSNPAAAAAGSPARQPLNLVACVNDSRTQQLMQSLAELGGGSSSSGSGSSRSLTLDLINPDELLSGVLMQVGALPERWVPEGLVPQAPRSLRAPAAIGKGGP